ncbi:16S rRNA (uracil(1498)-N(3))-methyltransferase [Sulfurirhabdus autotrophica]|uniref:Ribosomal RNA small subunit methyltransferase E n=2 Tax=Sulfurirhabdus autotrophica TaxID=1706046 RepID=A0A4R3XX35_9PROT|nr:16S rRNA (uracil(1498)-N(3))-methyltransferase [Sulfurirhabdus autotrophica]TCV84325.1 16S rRNA (uracil1498-N3)-methyltransferase [Sulfurirhabdus autotrophica]
MGFSRFYHSGDLGADRQITLSEQAAHHATRVLRLKTDDRVTLFNGQGGEYEATIVQAGKKDVTVKTGAWLDRECESPLNMTLVQAISSGEKMDFTLQKAVELGVAAIQPVISSRSVVRLEGERALKRVQHWQSVVISACEQCGRNRVPLVAPIMSLNHWLEEKVTSTLKLTLSPYAKEGLKEIAAPQGPIVFLVGPEGGFSESEEVSAAVSGFIPVKLGQRVLRTETAALAAISAMQMLWGDF